MNKQVLDRLEGGYALMVEQSDAGAYVFVGSESKGGESKVIMLDDGRTATVTTEVGGMMQIVPVPGRSGHYVAAMGMYAPFIGQEAGIYLLRPSSEPTEPWNVEKLFAMPFAHRVGFRDIAGRLHLFVATVSAHKENPDDWSRPGELFVTDFDRDLASGTWQLEPVTTGVFRNHGMYSGPLDGEGVLLISGAEGLFRVQADVSSPSGFVLDALIANEISEMVPADLDGDGADEMVTIEPFHGTKLCVYKRDDAGAWQVAWHTDDLSFAHGLNVVRCGSQPLVVVGSRREGMELLGYDFSAGLSSPRRIVIDRGVGPTQVEPISDGSGGVARIVSCNQGAGEVSQYEVSLDDVTDSGTAAR